MSFLPKKTLPPPAVFAREGDFLLEDVFFSVPATPAEGGRYEGKSDDVLELDEMWSFVFKKDNKRWIWTAIARKTRQIVAFVIGDRSEKTC